MFKTAAFLISLLAAIHDVSAAGHNVISVEPYLAEWCAATWPDKITYTGMDLAAHMKNRDYVRIEPVLGNYCFEQFPGELATQKREATLLKMKDNHIQIEPYLMEWGMVQMRTPSTTSRINLERYIQHWCVKGQFRKVINDHDAALANVFGPNALVMEPTFGKWCFQQFPAQLADVDQAEALQELETNHIPMEDYLIKWETADYGARKATRHPLNDENTAIGAGVGFAIALAVLLPLFGICWWCKIRNARKAAEFQRDVAEAEKDGIQMGA